MFTNWHFHLYKNKSVFYLNKYYIALSCVIEKLGQNGWGAVSCFSTGAGQSAGGAILKEILEEKVLHSETDGRGRWQVLAAEKDHNSKSSNGELLNLIDNERSLLCMLRLKMRSV